MEGSLFRLNLTLVLEWWKFRLSAGTVEVLISLPLSRSCLVPSFQPHLTVIASDDMEEKRSDLSPQLNSDEKLSTTSSSEAESQSFSRKVATYLSNFGVETHGCALRDRIRGRLPYSRICQDHTCTARKANRVADVADILHVVLNRREPHLVRDNESFTVPRPDVHAFQQIQLRCHWPSGIWAWYQVFFAYHPGGRHHVSCLCTRSCQVEILTAAFRSAIPPAIL